MSETDPHPVTGQQFVSPVQPGSGWPDDPATSQTPVAHSPAGVRRLAAESGDVAELQGRVSVCRACPRLVEWRESVARSGRRASFADEPYWGRPAPAFGDPDAEVLMVGLAPAANGANRTGRMFTGDASGDFLFAALHRTGYASQATSLAAGDGQRLIGLRMVAAVRCAPPQNKPTAEERSTCATWLRRELELSAPRLRTIVCMGAIGWNAALLVTGEMGWGVPRPRPRFAHGRVVELSPPGTRPVRVVGCFHVSPHNTFTGRLTAEMLDELLRSL